MNKNDPNKSEQRVGDALGKLGITVNYQHKVGPYSLDIFLPQYNVCIEIYGPHHVEKKRQYSDLARQKFLEDLGTNVYIITAQDAHYPQEVQRLVNKVINENTLNPKSKSVDGLNNMKDQLTEWINNNPLPNDTIPSKEVQPKETKQDENDFASLLDRYFPEEKSRSRK